MPDTDPIYLHLAPGESRTESSWVTTQASIHIFDYRIDDYDTEVFSLKSEFNHRSVIRELNWEDTHRKWVGDAWKIDFKALELVVQHLLDHELPLTIEPSVLRIFVADFDAPFLEAIIPSDGPPSDPRADIDDQLRLTDFDRDSRNGK